MKSSFFLSLALLLPSVALAHHGQDFLVNYDPDLPEPWSATAFSAFEWSRRGSEDELSFEPGFLLGLTPNFAAGTTVRFADDGTGKWDYAGVNPMIQLNLPLENSPVKFGLFAGYLFAEGSGHDLHIHQVNPGGIDQGPDAPPPGTVQVHDHSHSHGGSIHLHDQNHFQLRLLAEAEPWDKVRVIGNLIGVAPGNGQYDFGYSLGIRREISHAFAAGLETIGNFDIGDEHQVLAGIYWTPVHECTIRFGAGAGIGAASEDFSLHTGATWRF